MNIYVRLFDRTNYISQAHARQKHATHALICYVLCDGDGCCCCRLVLFTFINVPRIQSREHRVHWNHFMHYSISYLICEAICLSRSYYFRLKRFRFIENSELAFLHPVFIVSPPVHVGLNGLFLYNNKCARALRCWLATAPRCWHTILPMA